MAGDPCTRRGPGGSAEERIIFTCSKTQLIQALNGSAVAVERLIRRACSHGGQVGGFKRDIVVLLGYLTAHESHHRGSILLTAKQAGHPLDE